ncbi:MAG: diguanylate cyclase [Selenomonadaceae bacterium]
MTPLKNFSNDSSIDIYNALADFDQLLLFRWDLLLDEFSVSENAASFPYSLQSQKYFSTYMLTQHLVLDEDLPLIEEYMDYIFSEPDNLTNSMDRREVEYRTLTKDGQYRWIKLTLIAYFKDKRPYLIIGSIQDIHETKELETRLRREAERDALTGLYNKGTSQHLIELYLNAPHNQKFQQALLILDADGFKNINDTFGHLFGDAVLTDIALELEKDFRQIDIIGRIGGDEFIVLIKDIYSMDILRKKCQRIINNLHRIYKSTTQEIAFSVSIGIAIFPDHGTSFKILFEKADKALYNCKGNGKDTFLLYNDNLPIAEIPQRSDFSLVDPEQKAFKDHIVEYIFRLLYETHDAATTINMVFSLLGKQFNIDRAYIFLLNKKNNTLTMSYNWNSPIAADLPVIDVNDSSNTHMRSDAASALSQPTPYGIFSVCSDTNKLSKEKAAAFHKINTRSFINCQISNGTDLLGILGFEDCKNIRVWTKEEYEFMNIFSCILSEFLLKPENTTELTAQSTQLSAIINSIHDFIYIVDKDTYELLYFNQELGQSIPLRVLQQPCYSLLFGRETPCTNCPVKEISDYAVYIHRKMEHIIGFADVQVSNIEWNSPRKTALIIVRQKY